MRQWNVNPKLLCRNHLLGEHYETHKTAGCIIKNKSLKGYIEKNFLEIHNTHKRHDELVREMQGRGMNHKSPFPDIELYHAGEINIEENLKELANRCIYCKRRIENYE